MTELSPAASKASAESIAAAAAKGGYSRQAVMDRFSKEEEVERLQGSAAADDGSSWQARMASARLASSSSSPPSSSGPDAGAAEEAGLSMRVRAAQTGAAWTAAAAVAMRKAELKRRAVLSSPPRGRSHPLLGASHHAYYRARTLVLYSFQPTDQEALENLEFFVSTAVREHHAADYVFILQRNELRPYNSSALPALPPNARYIHYRGREECGGLGPIGWLLRQQHASSSATGAHTPPVVSSTDDPLFVAFGHYGYVMIVDSSMRGPWFPTWIDLDDPARVWYAAFQYHLERNAPDMRLVGSTLSCQYGAPHVQFGAIMLDAGGWDLLDSNRSSLLKCVPSWRSATYQSMGVSAAILGAGFNIGSQMLAYQEMDYRVAANTPARTCLGMALGDPQYDELKGPDVSDGHYMDPYELVFVKYTSQFKHYKSETFSDWKRWEKERQENNKNTDRYARRWTETDFRMEEEVKSREEEARLQPAP